MILRSLTVAASLLMISFTANAGLIYDEGVDGDLSNNPNAPTTVAIASNGANDLNGSIGGVADDRDNLTFGLGAGQTISSIILTAYSPTGSNISTGFNFWLGTSANTFLGSCGCGVGNIGMDLLAIAGIGSLSGVGDWTIDIREFGGSLNNTYSLQFNASGFAVPEPGTLALFGLGFLALGMRKRR